MSLYSYHGKNIRKFLQEIYDDGLQKSLCFSESEIEGLLSNIGIFKFKGYYYAFKNNPSSHTIDDVLVVYFFDKYLTKVLMDLTSSVETKLKTTLIELCYTHINKLPKTHPQKYNPFFYLIKDNYKILDPVIKGSTLENWKYSNNGINTESYKHYSLYYNHRYDFTSNRNHYLANQTLTKVYPDINYPPFHYLIESATLGTVIYFIKHLKIDNFDLIGHVANQFGVSNPNISFKPYLERLNEIRNRCAHRERIFNRSYRSVTGTGVFHQLRSAVSNHKIADVYMYLWSMLGWIDGYSSYDDFESETINKLFVEFREDVLIQKGSKGLMQKMDIEQLEKIMDFILRGMK